MEKEKENSQKYIPEVQKLSIEKYFEFENLCETREREFDENLNNIAYCLELKKTEELFDDFAKKLREQITVLAFGGNRVLLEVIDEDDAQCYADHKTFEEGTDNWVLKYLWQKYNVIRPIGLSSLFSNARRNEVYVHVEKEKVLQKIFKEFA
jgi:hypothetical protein